LIKNQNGVEKMGISFEDALKAQKAIEDKLLKDPNVVSIGVFEETNHLGQKSGNYSIKVGVISAELYQNTLEHGESIIPREYTFHSENGSREVKHVKINVVKTGQINALLASRNDFPSALDDIPAASLQTSDDHTSRERPSLCGQSIGHMSKGGDSGSCLFERGTQRPVGLLFAGHESETFHNPIKSVLSSLSSPWVNKYPSGKTHTFAKDHSLSIIRRNFSTGYLNSFYPSTRLTMTKSIKTHLPLVKRGMLFTSIGLFAINRTCKTLQSQIVVSSYNRTKRR
jgi:hypothetical protein